MNYMKFDPKKESLHKICWKSDAKVSLCNVNTIFKGEKTDI